MQYTIAVIFMLVGSVIHWTTLRDWYLVRETVAEPSNFLIHHHLHCYIRPIPIIYKLICKILKRNETNNSIHIPVMLYDYLEFSQNLFIYTPSDNTKTVHIDTNFNNFSSKQFPQIIHFYYLIWFNLKIKGLFIKVFV